MSNEENSLMMTLEDLEKDAYKTRFSILQPRYPNVNMPYTDLALQEYKICQ